MNENLSVHGWKTYLAAAAAILTGAVAIVNGHVYEGAYGIISGFALIGLRGMGAKILQLLLELFPAESDRRK